MKQKIFGALAVGWIAIVFGLYYSRFLVAGVRVAMKNADRFPALSSLLRVLGL